MDSLLTHTSRSCAAPVYQRWICVISDMSASNPACYSLSISTVWDYWSWWRRRWWHACKSLVLLRRNLAYHRVPSCFLPSWMGWKSYEIIFLLDCLQFFTLRPHSGSSDANRQIWKNIGHCLYIASMWQLWRLMLYSLSRMMLYQVWPMFLRCCIRSWLLITGPEAVLGFNKLWKPEL